MGAKGTQRHLKALKGTPNLNRMTSEAQSLDPPTRIEDLPRILNAEHEPEPGPDGLDPAGSKHPGLSGRRGNGTVARSPKAVRDQINIMILDGVRYDEIIRRLGDAGTPRHRRLTHHASN